MSFKKEVIFFFYTKKKLSDWLTYNRQYIRLYTFPMTLLDQKVISQNASDYLGFNNYLEFEEYPFNSESYCRPGEQFAVQLNYLEIPFDNRNRVREFYKEFPDFYKTLIIKLECIKLSIVELLEAAPQFFNRIDLYEFNFSLIHIYRYGFLLIKFYYMSMFSVNNIGIDQSLNPLKSLITSIFNFLLKHYRDKEFKVYEKIIILILNLIMYFDYQKELIIRNMYSRITFVYYYYFLKKEYELFFENRKYKYLSLISNSLPFTFLLFIRYNMDILYAGLFIKYYFIARISYACFIYLFQLMEIPYYFVSERAYWYRFKQVIKIIVFLPGLIAANLFSLYFIFKNLAEYLPTLSFLSVIILVSLKYLIFEKFIPYLPKLADKYKKYFKVDSVFGFFSNKQ